jgi:N-acetylmuramoyl-L-alanine amidase
MGKTENYLRNTKLINNKLKLTFKYEVDAVKHFVIKRNGIVKHIYDISEASLPRTINISKYKANGIKAFRIGQYNKKVVRVVIETTAYIDGSYAKKGKNVILNLPRHHKKSQKHTYASKKKYTNSHYKKNNYKKKLRPLTHYSRNSKRHKKLIILDAGHGGRDIGASARGVREKDLTLSMTLKLKRVLTKMGYRARLTRSYDKFMTLRERTEYANRNAGSLFISIHANAAPIKRNPRVNYKGIEIFYLSIKNSKRLKDNRAVYRGKKLYTRSAYKKMTSRWKYEKSHSLARRVKKHILRSVKQQYKIYDKGVKRQDFWVLLATQMPSILVETGYLTDKNELRKLRNHKYQMLFVEGIANGINEYYGLH